MGSVSAYAAAGAHRHTPEIEQALAEAAASDQDADIDSARFPRCGSASPRCSRRCPAASWPPAPPGSPGPAISAGELREAIAAAYEGEPFVTLLPVSAWPATASVAGSNGVHLQAAADERAGRAVVVAAIDNLGKGAAGQAIQNANLMLGLPEITGLTAIGVAP